MKVRSEDRECKKHGVVRHAISENGRYRCTKCRVESVERKRKKTKAKLVLMFGGGCQSCGYSVCIQALEFHHHDEETKEFSIFQLMKNSFDTILKEAKKCVLLCANCHREVHAGIRDCPAPLSEEQLFENARLAQW